VNTRALANAFVAGALFGVGLVVSGMSLPSKVLGFLDFFGNWDPSLMFVMLGAVGVHFWAYRLLAHRPSPYFASSFSVPARRDLDAKLISGAVLFGIGWGLSGLCPGPSLVALPSGLPGVVVFVAMMVVGMLVAKLFEKKSGSARSASAASGAATGA
jgi:uncharacterized membrane protein YedE/YeeE